MPSLDSESEIYHFVFQHLSEGEVIEGNIVQPEEDEENVMIMNDGAVLTSDQETLSTLANMASVAEISQQ